MGLHKITHQQALVKELHCQALMILYLEKMTSPLDCLTKTERRGCDSCERDSSWRNSKNSRNLRSRQPQHSASENNRRMRDGDALKK